MTPRLTTRGRTAPAPSIPPVGARGRTADGDLPSAALVRGAAALALVVLLCVACGAVADVPLAHLMAQATPGARRFAGLFSALGNSGYMLTISGVTAIAAYGAWRRGGRWAVRPVALLGERAAFVFGTIAASGVLAQLLKHLVGRARPKLIDTMGAFHFDLFSIKASLASFPSGHTASAFGLAVALGLVDRRLAPVLLVLAAFVATARVTLGAHYLSDVVAGAALGSAVSLGLAAICARYGFAFVRRGRRLHLKGDGTVWPGLVTLAHSTDRGA